MSISKRTLKVILWCITLSTHLLATEETDPDEKPDVTMREVTLQEINRDTGKGWRLKTPHSAIYRSRNIVKCQDAECTIMNNHNEIATLFAKNSTIDRTNGTIHLPSSVSGTFQGINIAGHSVTYNSTSHELHTNHTLRFTHPSFQFKAGKADINLKEKTASFSGGVTTQFTQPEPQQGR